MDKASGSVIIEDMNGEILDVDKPFGEINITPVDGEAREGADATIEAREGAASGGNGISCFGVTAGWGVAAAESGVAPRPRPPLLPVPTVCHRSCSQVDGEGARGEGLWVV